MNIKKFLVDFISVFAVTLVVSIIVTLLWNLLFHGESIIDWEASIRFALIFGIIFSWLETKKK